MCVCVCAGGRCGGEQHDVWHNCADVHGDVDDLGDQLLPGDCFPHWLWLH